MDVDLRKLPDDASLPKDIVLSLLNQLEVKYQEKIHHLEEQLGLFKNEVFARSSERHLEPPADQLLLFKGHAKLDTGDTSRADDKITVGAHTRKKRGRKPLPEDLPRIDIIHDLSENERQCACGARLSRFGEEVSEKLDYIPARLQVDGPGGPVLQRADRSVALRDQKRPSDRYRRIAAAGIKGAGPQKYEQVLYVGL
jgi:hypothetical protein